VRNVRLRRTHLDPDWGNLTYGDHCRNPRARALVNVEENDILLFWALLWHNSGMSWETFSGSRSWGFIGCMRVREILEAGHRPRDARTIPVGQVRRNAHFRQGRVPRGDRVFIGCRQHSRLFGTAVDLQVGTQGGLVYRTIRTAKGEPLPYLGRWSSYLRACRTIWDLESNNDRRRAEIAENAIAASENGFRLLADL
jgi:hypothetical protein